MYFKEDRLTVYLRNSDQTEVIKFLFLYSPFKIVQYINEKVTVVVNDLNNLRYAALLLRTALKCTKTKK